MSECTEFSFDANLHVQLHGTLCGYTHTHVFVCIAYFNIISVDK
jgi:hypothetical protein